MSNIDLHEEYNSNGESVHDLFGREEEGFFVPLFQREYTWEEDNINQLFEDLVLGIQELTNNGGDNATTFLGTVILTKMSDTRSTVKEGDDRAQPTAVRSVIDGQQRISTVALLSIQLIERLKSLRDDLPDKDPYTVLRNHCEDQIEKLQNIYTINLKRGANPPSKPKIILAKEDRWTYDGDDDSYGSPVAHYIAKYIRTGNPQKALDAIDKNTGVRVIGNVKLINQWIDKVCDSHIQDTDLYDQFPVGNKIATDKIQEYVFGFRDCNLKAVIEKAETDKKNEDYVAVAIYHVFLLAYYLLRRCGVNRLQPTHEEWGFDMFQALNATGTPLTAIETFLPQVMQAEQGIGNNWVETPSSGHMEDIDKLFEAATSNEQKNRRTNELLSAFSLCYKGKKLGNKFSAQRRWMTSTYANYLQTIEEKRKFLSSLAQVANFFHAAWYMEELDSPFHIKGLEDHPDGEIASFLVQYLKDANSRLSAPILARFYSQSVEQGCMGEFVEATKACAAFFTIWRSASSTSGLDEIYRKFFRGSDRPVKVGKHSWKAHPREISSKSLKQYFLEVLKNKKIDEKDAWVTESERFLIYTELRTICRFVLFLAGHDQVSDDSNPGLTTQGTKGTCPLLKLESWKATEFKSLEHVAPQNPPARHKWDKKIYSENKVNEVGNLILLPIDINKHVNNKEWAVKFLHYSHVGVRVKEKIKDLEEESKNKGIVLSKKATKTLSEAKYNCAVGPILKLGIEGPWNTDIIDRRTQQIKEIAWEKIISWLNT